MTRRRISQAQDKSETRPDELASNDATETRKPRRRTQAPRIRRVGPPQDRAARYEAPAETIATEDGTKPDDGGQYKDGPDHQGGADYGLDPNRPRRHWPGNESQQDWVRLSRWDPSDWPPGRS